MTAIKVCARWSICGAVWLLLMAQPGAHGQSTFQLSKFTGARVYDANGIPLAGTNYSVELWGSANSNSLAAASDFFIPHGRVIIHFLTGTNAGFFSSGQTVVENPGAFAWLQVRAWDARLGATYEDVVATGLGGYGGSNIFYEDGGDPFAVPPEAPGRLFGMQSFNLLPVIPEPSSFALLALGGGALWHASRKRRRL